MKLKNLEMALQRLTGYDRPSPALEQYQTPAPLAARLLYTAFMNHDIADRQVCDLGSGTGVLAIGAALLGASKVTGVEIDEVAVTTAAANAALLNADVEFIVADVRDTTLADRLGSWDTVIMNPPFGAQNAHADRPFIDCALRIAPVTYGIFNAGSTQFVDTFIQNRARITERIAGTFPIRRTFFFHTRDVQEIGVEILRLTRRK
jgi:putative methylase